MLPAPPDMLRSSRRARLDEEKARRAAVARSGRDAEKQRVKRDEDRARKDAVTRSRAEATEERARKKAEAEQLRGAVKRGKRLEPLVVDDASSYVSFDESVGTFAGGPSLFALRFHWRTGWSGADIGELRSGLSDEESADDLEARLAAAIDFLLFTASLGVSGGAVRARTHSRSGR